MKQATKAALVLKIERRVKLYHLHRAARKTQAGIEQRLTTKLAALLSKTESQMIAKLQAAGRIPGPNDPAINSFLQFLEQTREPFTEEIENAAMEAAENGVRDLDQELAALGTQMHFKTINTTTESMIRNGAFNASQETLDRMIGDVRQTLADGFKQGKGIPELTKMIGQNFTNMKGYELARIARTETITAQNQARHVQMIQNNIDYEQWWGANDERTRGTDPRDKADHRAGPPGMHGQIAGVSDTFSNGLRFPGDTAGRIEEWINCRCRPVPFLMPFGFAPPAGATWFYESQLVRTDAAAEGYSFGNVTTEYQRDEATLTKNSEEKWNWLREHGHASSDNKARVVKNLSERLKDNRDFQIYAAERWKTTHGVGLYKTDRTGAAVDDLVRLWAGTSGDNNPKAIALQQAAAKEFGTGTQGLKHIKDKGILRDAAELLKTDEKAYRAFLRAQYAQTQAELAASNIDEVILYRGMGIDDKAFKKMTGVALDQADPNTIYTGINKVQLQPLSSFASETDTASSFASTYAMENQRGGHMIMTAKVPANRVIGTPRTGYGCLTENEFVVIGGAPEKWNTVTAGNWQTIRGMQNMDEMAKALKERTILKDTGEYIILTPDEELINADWTKTAWDLQINSAEEIQAWLKAEGISIAAFKKLPVYQHNKDKIPWLKEI